MESVGIKQTERTTEPEKYSENKLHTLSKLRNQHSMFAVSTFFFFYVSCSPWMNVFKQHIIKTILLWNIIKRLKLLFSMLIYLTLYFISMKAKLNFQKPLLQFVKWSFRNHCWFAPKKHFLLSMLKNFFQDFWISETTETEIFRTRWKV